MIKIISVSMQDKTLALVDANRGQTPRSTFIAELIKTHARSHRARKGTK